MVTDSMNVSNYLALKYNRQMRTINKMIYAVVAVLVLTTSCYDDYVADYEEPSMGFTISQPVRTVIAERDMTISIGVAIGGKREVDTGDWARFSIDAALLEGTGKTLLPAEYYELSDPSMMKVHKANLPVADVEIRLKPAFFADPLSMKNHYVLPFRMTENSLGVIREGAETTIAVVKYISTFAGTYYRMGQVQELNAAGQPVGDVAEFGNTHDINLSPTVTVETLGPRTVRVQGLGKADGGVGGFDLDIDTNLKVSVAALDGKAPLNVSSATYRQQGDYGFVANLDVKAPQIDLDYIYTDGDKKYHVKESLVLRQDPLDDLRVETW